MYFWWTWRRHGGNRSLDQQELEEDVCDREQLVIFRPHCVFHMKWLAEKWQDLQWVTVSSMVLAGWWWNVLWRQLKRIKIEIEVVRNLILGPSQCQAYASLNLKIN